MSDIKASKKKTRSSDRSDKNPAKKQKSDELFALSEQVRYLTECVEKVLNKDQGQVDNEGKGPVYGIPGPSQTKRELIIISSDEDDNQNIKKETKEKVRSAFSKDVNISNKKNKLKKRTVKKSASKKAKGKVPSESANSLSSDSELLKDIISKNAKGKVPSESVNNSSSSSDNIEYFSKNEMPKSLKEALRWEVIRLYDQLPGNNQLDLNRTFIQQRKVVNSIIVPTIMSNINTSIFPVFNSIIYQIIQSLHRHRREEFLKKNRPQDYQKDQGKRKHSNTRRYDKRIKRAGIIGHLQFVEDKLIGNFKSEDLQPVIDNNAYHSPEDSETDQENPSSERNIVIKDLSWRSSTLRMFLRNYIDRLHAEKSKVPKKRNRIFDHDHYKENERSAPLLAPKWTRAGYDGLLKHVIMEACKEQGNGNESDALSNLMLYDSSENTMGSESETEEEEETVLLTGGEKQEEEELEDSSELEMDD